MLCKSITISVFSMIIGLSLVACTSSVTVTPPASLAAPADLDVSTLIKTVMPGAKLRVATFTVLPGWEKDDLRQVIPAFLVSCRSLGRQRDWVLPCSEAMKLDGRNEKAIRHFFHSFFTPYQVINQDNTEKGLVTAYYEPFLKGSRKRSDRYQIPLYRAPDDLITVDLSRVYPELKGLRVRGRLVENKVIPYFTRAELAQSTILAGKEIVWVEDPVDAFFLQVQGSGKVRLDESNEIIRLAYANQNGHPYRSIGRYLVDRGELSLSQASAQGIKAWLTAHPHRQQELFNVNPGFVFFKEEKVLDQYVGPTGAQGVPLTAQRSIAVDPQFIPLGLPVFLATTQPNSSVPLQRLVVAQDTGGAIKGVVRADLFWGAGEEAGNQAGKMKQQGTMWLFLPKSVRMP